MSETKKKPAVDHTLAVGDVVRLKCGGPRWVVSCLNDDEEFDETTGPTVDITRWVGAVGDNAEGSTQTEQYIAEAMLEKVDVAAERAKEEAFWEGRRRAFAGDEARVVPLQNSTP